jgi:2,6-dihydroxypyridine 3-monooxygenase
VIGGSIGGLSAALWLRELGYDVDIYERSSGALEARGAGIAVLDDTIRYLAEHRLVERGAICTRTGWVRYLHPDGTTRYEEARPYRFSSWNTIYRNLLSCLPSAHYRLGKQAEQFQQDDETVRVSFADGTSTSCDLLVGADGIDSTVRQRLLPDLAPRYAGYVAWRGTVPERALAAATRRRLGDAITYQLLEHSHILVYPIPSLDGAVEPPDRLLNFVWYRNVAEGEPLDTLLTDRDGRRRAVSLPPGAAQDHLVEALHADARRILCAPIADAVLTTEQPFVQMIVDLGVPAMAFGRACLLGDAAFALRPHAGAGTAKAVNDAWALRRALADAPGDLPRALDRWQEGQLALGRQVMQRARTIGDRSQSLGTWRAGDAELVFGLHQPGH